MSAINNGGAAFPLFLPPSETGDNILPIQYGMSLRDYFAAKAIAGLCARDLTENCLSNGHINHAYVRGISADRDARLAYQYADAMLRAREETK